MRKFEVCDNVDLEMMLLEFESYHYLKFHKFPKVIRKATAGMKPLGSSRCCSLEAGVEVGPQLINVWSAGDSRTAGVPQKR